MWFAEGGVATFNDLSLTGTGSGRLLLIVVIVMWLGGLAWARRIVMPEV